MTDQDLKNLRRAFTIAEANYRAAARGLWQAAGATNATWEERTLIEVAARRYCAAADTYRSQTRALFQAKQDAPSEGKGVSPPHSIE